MEHRKEYGSPRDMLDDAMLQRILTDMAGDDSCRCGERSGSSDNERTGDARRGYERSGCGCHGSERSSGMQRDSERTGCGCGCRDGEYASAARQTRQSCSCGRSRSQIQSRQEIQQNENCPCQEDSCVSGKSMPTLQGLSLAMVYSPHQEWNGILEPEEALAKGTLFSGLVFPWHPSRCHEGRDCGCGRD